MALYFKRLPEVFQVAFSVGNIHKCHSLNMQRWGEQASLLSIVAAAPANLIMDLMKRLPEKRFR